MNKKTIELLSDILEIKETILDNRRKMQKDQDEFSEFVDILERTVENEL